MSERFAKKWETSREETSFVNSIRESVTPPSPLKPRLDHAIRRLDLQINKSGTSFSEDDVTQAATVAVLGDTVRKDLFGSRNPVGETIRVGTLPCDGFQRYDESKPRRRELQSRLYTVPFNNGMESGDI